MRRAVCLMAVISLLFAACSESDSDDEATETTEGTEGTEQATTTGAGDTTGVTDTEIRIGGIYDEARFGDARAGAQARIDRENAAGGVEGRQIVLVDMIDDGADTNASNDAARRLVEQEQVFAVGPITTPAFAAGDYLAEQGVSFFGWGISPAWCGNEYGFSLVRCTDPSQSTTLRNFALSWAAVLDPEPLEGKTLAVIADDNDAGRAQLPTVEHVATEAGVEPVYVEATMPPPPAVVGDYTPYATEILSSADGGPPDIISLLVSAPATIGLAAKLRELGYEGLVFNGILYDPRAVAISQPTLTILANAAFEEADEIPAMKQTVEDLDATDPPTTHSSAALTAYWAMDEFIQVLREVGPDLTRERFVEVLNGEFEFDGQGVFSDLTYPEAHDQGIPSCFAVVSSDGTAYHVEVSFTCGEDVPNPNS